MKNIDLTADNSHKTFIGYEVEGGYGHNITIEKCEKARKCTFDAYSVANSGTIDIAAMQKEDWERLYNHPHPEDTALTQAEVWQKYLCYAVAMSRYGTRYLIAYFKTKAEAEQFIDSCRDDANSPALQGATDLLGYVDKQREARQ